MMEKIFQGPFAKKNMFLQPCFSAVKYQRTKSAPLADECASTKAEAQKKHSKVQLLILPLISKPKRKRFTPLTENHFAKKPLAERGGSPPPPPLNGKLPKIFLKKWVKKG